MAGVEGNPYRLPDGVNAAGDDADASTLGTRIGRWTWTPGACPGPTPS